MMGCRGAGGGPAEIGGTIGILGGSLDRGKGRGGSV